MSNEQEFEAWLQRERPAGCVADMARGWKAGRAALAATPAPAPLTEPITEHLEKHLPTYASKHPSLLVRQLATALMAATPAPAEPLTDEQMNHALGLQVRMWLSFAGDSIPRKVERACAEAWGVKLAEKPKASTGGQP